jgi:hypothetical protein
MADNNRVFVSCVSDEFQKDTAPFPGFRERLRGYLVAADCEAKVQEDFRQRGDADTVEKLADYIKTCAAVIHLVGAVPGAVANAKAVATFLATPELNFLGAHPDLRAALGDCSDITYTQWEAFLALHYDVPLFVYVTEKGKDAQKVHLGRLRTARKYPGDKSIAEPADLLGQLIGDLRYIVPAFGGIVQRLARPRFLHHTAELFLGREAELELLDRAWADGTNVLSVIAWGGVGKTALLSEWIQTRFIDKAWKDAEGNPSPLAYLDWSFYDQGTRATADEMATRTGSVGDFFEQALAHFGDADVTRPGKGTRLAGFVRRQRTLFILDGLEPLQHPVGSPIAGRMLDPDLRDFVTALAQSNPGLLVVTSRQALTDLDGLHGFAARKQDLDDLPKPVAVRLLRRMQITGTDPELEDASEKFGCHALSLTLLGRFLFDAHQGDIRRIDRVRDLKRADELTREERHRTAWKVLDAYQDWLARAKADGNPKTLAVLRLTGLFDRTASGGCLAALRAGPVIPGLTDAIVGMGDDEWNILLNRLERAHLIKLKTEPDVRLAVDAHPLVREYFAKQLRDTQPDAFRAAHSRLFDHLCETTPHRPDALDGLQPLYQAVVHGCLAGRHQEACDKVYFDRILRGKYIEGYFSRRQLGAVSADLEAVAAFFEQPWNRLSSNLSPRDQAWLLSEAALRLRSLGRLSEALEPLQVSLKMDVESKKWKEAANRSSDLSELAVMLGQLTSAVDAGRRSIAFADGSGVNYWKMISRTATADALHQNGESAEAKGLFVRAEQIQARRKSGSPLLRLQPGFLYADLLLVPAERAVWQSVLKDSPVRTSASVPDNDQHPSISSCAEAERRANKWFEWRKTSDSLRTVALEQLTLARAHLYEAILSTKPRLTIPKLSAEIELACAKLHEANSSDYLTKALLTAALFAGTLRGQLEETYRLLAETQQIAERGPMPLFLADVHLHRARLFRDRAELAKAAKLIRELGYGRRYDELADAEEAAARWSE